MVTVGYARAGDAQLFSMPWFRLETGKKGRDLPLQLRFAVYFPGLLHPFRKLRHAGKTFE
jgi:hypothetical protein